MRPQLLVCLRKACGRDQGAPKRWKYENEERSNSSVVASFGVMVLSRYRVFATWMWYNLKRWIADLSRKRTSGWPAPISSVRKVRVPSSFCSSAKDVKDSWNLNKSHNHDTILGNAPLTVDAVKVFWLLASAPPFGGLGRRSV